MTSVLSSLAPADGELPLLDGLLAQPAAERIGWALLHSVWQGILVALLLAIALELLRRRSANIRYLVSCAALLVMTVLPVATLLLERGGRLAAAVGSPVPGLSTGGVTERIDDTPHAVPSGLEGITAEAALVERPAAGPPEMGSAAGGLSLPAGMAPVAFPEALKVPVEPLAVRVERVLRPWLPWLVAMWLTGVLLLSVRLLSGWRMVQRLRRESIRPASGPLGELLDRLARKLGVRRAVCLLESSLVEVPTMIGWLKPVILLPLTATSGLTASQLESILAHELAHIRRADYLVNLLQNLVEILLFYHPAVWWISARIRQEREHCCDDLAIQVCGDAAGYAAVLLRMEELRAVPGGMALAVRGGRGSLLFRVRRLLGTAPRDAMSPWWVSGAVAMLIAGSTLSLLVYRASQAGEGAGSGTSPRQDDIPATSTDGREPASAVSGRETTGSTPSGRDQAATDGDAVDDSGSTALVPADLTSAQVADRIEAAWKNFESIEYSAQYEDTRNTRALGAEPLLVNGRGDYVYRSDGRRWFVHENGFTTSYGATDVSPSVQTAGFDGQTHFHQMDRGLELGKDSMARDLMAPQAVFWKAGITTGWLLSALRRPEAEIVDRVQMEETSCLLIRVQWKPDWDTMDRLFEIYVCPEQSWLPRRVRIERGGEPDAEWHIADVARTESGLWYPTEIRMSRSETDFTPRRRLLITSLRERQDFRDDEFAVPVAPGTDITDHRSGFTWHNDPWWPGMAPWFREQLDWPRPDTTPLRSLASHANPKMQDQPAPAIEAAEWITEPFTGWQRDGRVATVLYFFGGRPIHSTPGELAALRALHDQYRSAGVEIVAIASATPNPGEVRQTVRELRLGFPVAVDAALEPGRTGYGRTSSAFGLRSYTGTMVIDSQGRIHLVNPQSGADGGPVRSLEQVLRSVALGLTEPDSSTPDERERMARRVSLDLTGVAPARAQLDAVRADGTPEWLSRYVAALEKDLPEPQKKALGFPGVEPYVEELTQSPDRLSRVAERRVEAAWKASAAAQPGHASIAGQILISHGPRDEWGPSETLQRLTAANATIHAVPQFRILSFTTPGGWYLMYDRSRAVTVSSDQTGSFQLPDLRKGAWELTVSSPGMATIERTVMLSGDDSLATLDVVLRQGGTISGLVQEESGAVVAGASVRMTQRHFDPAARVRYTTAHLPRDVIRSDAEGRFRFPNLYDGAYSLEVLADGFEPVTLTAVPAGRGNLQVVLKRTGTGSR